MPLCLSGEIFNLIFGFARRAGSWIILLLWLRRAAVADDVAVSGFYDRIRAVNADFDLPTLPGLSGIGRIITDVILPPQFFGDAGESVFQTDIRFGAEQSAARFFG